MSTINTMKTSVKVGQTILVEVTSLASAGYLWNLGLADPDVAKVTQKHEIASNDLKSEDFRIGGFTTIVLEIQGLSQGTTRVRQEQPWNSNNPLDILEIDVVP